MDGAACGSELHATCGGEPCAAWSATLGHMNDETNIEGPRRPGLALPELLAPARDREAFLAAIAAGADAIYCGVTGGLNARRKAAGIAEEELAPLCAFAHARGVRVFVTANVVVKQTELPAALAALERYARAGADAFIIQDWGLLSEARRALPQVELHVSTQANVHDARGVRLCEGLGAKRVTLSRELPLDEIAAIARATAATLEVFAHGAICPCYSGVCMLSSFLREGRSPNRGLCAQPCRLPFDLVDASGVRLQPPECERPLCTHDNCAIGDIAGLARAGAGSLKLEGRMKPADYVYAVTSAWRRELDAVGARVASVAPGASPEVEGRVRRRLKRSFNRGLTDCYLHGRSGNELMSYERSGNRGELVGEVVGFEPEPGFVPRDGQRLRGTAALRLLAPVGEGDSLELRHPAEPTRFLVVTSPRAAEAGARLLVAVPRPMPLGAEVCVTKSVALEREADEAIRMTERAFAESEGEDVHARGEGRDGASREGTASGEAGRCILEPKAGVGIPEPTLCALTGRLEEVAPLRAAGAERIYLDVCDLRPTPETLAAARVAGAIPVLDEVCREPDHARLDPWVAAGESVAVGSVSELALACERGAKAEVRSCIPVHNAAALDVLSKLGASGAWLSPELSRDEVAELAWAGRPRMLGRAPVLGMLVYGRPRLMTCEHCVLQAAYDCDGNHERCRYRTRRHWLVNIDGRRLPVRTDARGRSRLLLDEPLDLIPEAGELTRMGVGRLLVDASSTSLGEACEALRRLGDVLAGKPATRAGVEGLLAHGVA